ncbi:MAG: hypothetical protein JWR08_1607 [Enterovirga sp.]|nr:hypothetical protein [Enterovirga sp.]
MSGKFAQSVTEAAFEAGEAAINSAVTIAARLPILASPSAEGLAEWQDAASEKVLATWEGALAAFSGLNELMWRSVFAPITPAGMAHEAMVLVRAASAPGHLRVRANAERFRGR